MDRGTTQHDEVLHAQHALLKRLESVYKLLSDAALELAASEDLLRHVDTDTVDAGLTALFRRALDLHAAVVTIQNEADAVIDALIDRVNA